MRPHKENNKVLPEYFCGVVPRFFMKFILGAKIGMTQIFDEKGNQVPLTLIEAGPCVVTEVKDQAVQIGFIKKTKNIKKTQKGKEYKYLREFKIQNSNLKINDTIDASMFQEGEKVKIAGISKGKGFQGGVKRWGFHGRNRTHGTKHEERTIGATGSARPQRVTKGRKMPGRAGSKRTTIKNLKIIKADKENNILAVRGAVPGREGTLLEISNF